MPRKWKDVPAYAIVVHFGRPGDAKRISDAAVVTSENPTEIYCVGAHFGTSIAKESGPDDPMSWERSDWTADHDKIGTNLFLTEGGKL